MNLHRTPVSSSGGHANFIEFKTTWSTPNRPSDHLKNTPVRSLYFNGSQKCRSIYQKHLEELVTHVLPNNNSKLGTPVLSNVLQNNQKTPLSNGTPHNRTKNISTFHYFNPFEAGTLDSLEGHKFSPNVFKTSTPDSSLSETFQWSIDEIANLKPTEIEDPPDPDTWINQFNPELEARAQLAINSYFSNNIIVPSPWTDSGKKKKIHSFIDRGLNVDAESNQKTEIKDFNHDLLKLKEASCQTAVSLPIDFDLISVLGQAGLALNTSNDEDQGNVSLRRKLFFHASSPLKKDNYDEKEYIINDEFDDNFNDEFLSSNRVLTAFVSPSNRRSSLVVNNDDDLLMSPINVTDCNDLFDWACATPVGSHSEYQNNITMTSQQSRVKVENRPMNIDILSPFTNNLQNSITKNKNNILQNLENQGDNINFSNILLDNKENLDLNCSFKIENDYSNGFTPLKNKKLDIQNEQNISLSSPVDLDKSNYRKEILNYNENNNLEKLNKDTANIYNCFNTENEKSSEPFSYNNSYMEDILGTENCDSSLSSEFVQINSLNTNYSELNKFTKNTKTIEAVKTHISNSINCNIKMNIFNSTEILPNNDILKCNPILYSEDTNYENCIFTKTCMEMCNKSKISDKIKDNHIESFNITQGITTGFKIKESITENNCPRLRLSSDMGYNSNSIPSFSGNLDGSSCNNLMRPQFESSDSNMKNFSAITNCFIGNEFCKQNGDITNSDIDDKKVSNYTYSINGSFIENTTKTGNFNEICPIVNLDDNVTSVDNFKLKLIKTSSSPYDKDKCDNDADINHHLIYDNLLDLHCSNDHKLNCTNDKNAANENTLSDNMIMQCELASKNVHNDIQSFQHYLLEKDIKDHFEEMDSVLDSMSNDGCSQMSCI